MSADCETYNRIEGNGCAEACLPETIGICPRSIVIATGQLKAGNCSSEGFKIPVGEKDQKCGPCGIVKFMQFNKTALVNSDTSVMLETFDGTKGSSFKWRETDDPVMGGQSAGSFDVSNNTAVFKGTTKIVPSLKAPGFCKATTSDGFLAHDTFNDASAFINGGIIMRARTMSPTYKGFKFGFGAKNISSHTKRHGPQSFKADFQVTAAKFEWQIVKIPFTSFSSDWSDFTGSCTTKDPTGQQHVCCTKATQDVCPKSWNLNEITDLEIWSEGTAGKFYLEIDYIAAGEM